MKPKSLLAIGLILCASCNERQTTEVKSNEDTTIVATDVIIQTDTTLLAPATTIIIPDSLSDEFEFLEEKGEWVYVSKHEFSYISNPYDFDLVASTIEGLLGKEAKTKVEEFEAGQDYSAYTYTTITYRDDTELSFYDYSGKHISNITTPLLPLKNGVVIGMKKGDFLNAMGYHNSNASKATKFRLEDDYGSMEFSFRADTLYNIYARYEEGD